MITIKLPIKLDKVSRSIINEVSKQYSSTLRYSYNRYKDGLNQKEIRLKSKELNNIELLDSWLIQCAILEAKACYIKNDHIIFGGKKNFELRSQHKITREKFLEKRKTPINSQGEILKYGNRKFNLDIIENNKIVFKLNRKIHVDIELPKLKKNYTKQLYLLEELAKFNKVTYSIKLSTKYIWISFDERILNKKQIILNSNRVLGIDLNPSEIGISILEFDNEDKYKLIHNQMIKTDDSLIKNLKLSSSALKNKYQNNKKNYEIISIVKHIFEIAKHYKCCKIVAEDLHVNSKKYKSFNRLINNVWNVTLFQRNLKKRCSIYNIEFIKINPAYSSFVGNMVNNNYPDPVSASIEIGRRGYKKFEKNWFYPKFNKENLMNQWKEDLDWSQIEDWKQLFKEVKNSKVKYRISLDLFKSKVLRLDSWKSKVQILCILPILSI